MAGHRSVSREEWLVAREELLKKEKHFTRLRDELSQARRELPWVRVDKEYVFDTATGEQSLADLFEGSSQLIIYHFMFGPDWEEGCPCCSFWADNYKDIAIHLKQRDIAMVTISRATLEKLDAYKKRMGWQFRWVSSGNSDFNSDYQVSFSQEEIDAGEVNYNYQKTRFPSTEAPGISVFYKGENNQIFHTYSCYARGLDMLNGAYHLMDLTPKGRDEDELDFTMAWVKRHDCY